jgi:hypothetical protein
MIISLLRLVLYRQEPKLFHLHVNADDANQPDRSPGRYVASLSHERAESKPKTVEYREVVGVTEAGHLVFDLPLVRTEPADQKQHHRYADVRHDNTNPNVRTEWCHEREDARLQLLRLLYHDADAEFHERLREVDDAFSLRRNRQRCNGQISLLYCRTSTIAKITIINLL